MGRLIVWLLLLPLVLGWGYQTLTEPQLKYNSAVHRLTHPLDTRVRYRIGTVDPRFGLSHDEVKALSLQAADIWQAGTGRAWFVYDESARLSINFIYDERQAKTDAREQTRIAIEGMVDAHKQDGHTLDAARRALNARGSALELQLRVWTHEHQRIITSVQNGEPNSDYSYQQSLAKRQALDDEIAQYEAAKLTFNQQVAAFNHQAQTVDDYIKDANARFAPRTFHKGVFDGRHIDIYEFSSRDDLRLLLAHELGHALDIAHHDDPKGLMYPMAQAQDTHNFHLQPSDVALLNQRRAW